MARSGASDRIRNRDCAEGANGRWVSGELSGRLLSVYEAGQRRVIPQNSRESPEKESFPLNETKISSTMTLDHNQQISTERLGLPEVLTARDLEALLKIDVKTIYHYVRS